MPRGPIRSSHFHASRSGLEVADDDCDRPVAAGLPRCRVRARPSTFSRGRARRFGSGASLLNISSWGFKASSSRPAVTVMSLSISPPPVRGFLHLPLRTRVIPTGPASMIQNPSPRTYDVCEANSVVKYSSVSSAAVRQRPPGTAHVPCHDQVSPTA